MSEIFDFDQVIDRSETGSYKIEVMEHYFGTKDALPLWVADMDFATPNCILEAIKARCDRQILGYTIVEEDWYTSIKAWLSSRYHWEVQPDEIIFVPGIVSGIAFALQCFTNPGDKVLIQTPVYPPFFDVPKKNNSELVINQLRYQDRQVDIDFDDFESKAASGCKLFILCSPHNPGGIVWPKEKLERMLDICRKYNILVVSDEIHADLTLPGYKHLPISTLSKNQTDRIITLMAPSKTFNIPGLCGSFYIIQNKGIRNQLINFLDQASLSSGNLFAFLSAQAAFEKGGAWLNQLIDYLQDNINYVADFIQTNMPKIHVCKPQASFLVLLDGKQLNMNPKALQKFFLEEAKLAWNPGYSFGPGGEPFMRLNIGCPRSTLREAMERLRSACERI